MKAALRPLLASAEPAAAASRRRMLASTAAAAAQPFAFLGGFNASALPLSSLVNLTKLVPQYGEAALRLQVTLLLRLGSTEACMHACRMRWRTHPAPLPCCRSCPRSWPPAMH